MTTAREKARRSAQRSGLSLAERLAGKKPVSTTHTVTLDPEPMRLVQEADDAVRTARLFGVGDLAEAEKRLEKARADAAAADASVTLHLQGLPRDAYEALILAHPPTPEQRKENETYDVDTFAPAVVALCIVEPDGPVQPLTADDIDELQRLDNEAARAYLLDTGRSMTPDDLADAWKTWNQGEQGSLYQAALSVCTQARNPGLPFG